jgi:hypothetical protein
MKRQYYLAHLAAMLFGLLIGSLLMWIAFPEYHLTIIRSALNGLFKTQSDR